MENWGLSGPNDVACLSKQVLYKSYMTLGIPLGLLPQGLTLTVLF